MRAVIGLNSEHIKPPPKIGSELSTEFIRGMGKVDDQFIIILNIAKILSAVELIMVQDAAGKETATSVA